MSSRDSIADRTFFTSDQHFGHRNIIKHAHRPFDWSDEGLAEMDEALIASWNSVVPPNGLVYHLGDIFLSPRERAVQIRERLHGQIFLIRGNHEKVATGLPSLFEWTKDYYKLRVPDAEADGGEQRIILFHYPIASFESQHHGAWHVFGHCHSSFNPWQSEHLPEKRMLDVGVDNIARLLGAGELDPIHYRPMAYREIKRFMSTKSGGLVTDHHR